MTYINILGMMEENAINEKTLEELENLENYLNKDFLNYNYSFDIKYFDDGIEVKTENDSIFLNIDDTKFYSIVAGDDEEIIFKDESLLNVIQEYLNLDIETDVYICKEESYEILYM